MNEHAQPQLVTRVDHLYARVDDPGALFRTLTERFGLPRSYDFTRLPICEGGAVSGERRLPRGAALRARSHAQPPRLLRVCSGTTEL